MSPPSDSAPAALPTPESSATAAAEPAPAPAPAGLVKNTFYLAAAQAVTIPISVLGNAMAGRYLGPAEFGYLYLATTLCSFGVLGVEWGQQGALPALVARDRSRAGAYLGTSLAWRAFASVFVALLLALACWLLGYDSGARWAVALSFPLACLNSVALGFKDAIRGFERTDIPAIAHVAQQLMTVGVMVPVLIFGGDLRALLISQTAVAAITVLQLRRSLKHVGVASLSFDRTALPPLFRLGTPFVVFGLAMVVAPNVNATFLSKLVPPEVIGWYGVSQRLIGLLIFPASAVIGALYPTLCRLHTEDRAEFVRVSQSSLYGVVLLAVPAAVGCGMFPELGVAVFGSEKYSGAADHLRVMSAFILLVYVSMPLGTTILAGTRQKAWSLVQSLCIVVSLVGSPFLVPYFQRRMGNGAIGTCITLVLSEVLVVAFGVLLSPKGLFDRGFAKSIALASLAGAAMAAAAYFTKPISLFLAVPVSLLTYGAFAWLSGAVQPATMDMIKRVLGRKFARFRS